jgi:undecaprenyl phosphate-alpha-L-ara4N flippase subunit ArnE
LTSAAPVLLGLFLTPVLISAGQVLFKLAGTRLSLRQGRGVFSALLDPYLLVAFGIYAIGTLLWVYVLSKLPLRTAYPVMALTYLLVPAASRLILSESIAPSYWAGAVLVVAGVVVMTASA